MSAKGASRRKVADAGGIPADLARWFAGDDPHAPWGALLWPEYESVPRHWAAWLAAHPGAVHPPASWIAWPTP